MCLFNQWMVFGGVSVLAVLLLFSSGRVVCAEAKSKEMVTEAVTKMYEILQDYGLLYTPT